MGIIISFQSFLLYSVRDCGILCLYWCMTLATTLLALDILYRHFYLRVLVQTAIIRGFDDCALYKSTFYIPGTLLLTDNHILTNKWHFPASQHVMILALSLSVLTELKENTQNCYYN